MQIPSDPNDPRHKLALFRHSVVSSLLHRNDGETLQDLMQRKSEQRYDIPGSTRTHIAIETMRDWLRAYRKGGYEALLPKGAHRHGPSTRHTRTHRRPSSPLVIAAARDQGGVSAEITLAPSTVHRLLIGRLRRADET